MTKEVLGENEVFDSYQSNVEESISVDEAKAQEKVAEEVRAEEGEE